MISPLPNPLSYLDHYGYSNTLAISKYVQIVREVTSLLRAGLKPCMWAEAETISVCWTVAVWGCLFISYVQQTEHASLVLGRPVARTTFGMDRSVLWVTAAVMILGRGWGFNFLTSSSMGTSCRQGKAMTHLSSIPGFSPCISPKVQFCPGILSYRLHSWSWSPRHPLCTWTLKLLGHRVRLWCALTF